MKWILYFTYFFVFIILLFRYLFNLSRIFRKDGDNYSFLYKGYKVVVLENNVLPFSFLHTIYINRKDFNNGAVKQELLIHELTHIKEKHSIDILLIELLQVFCWFNPIIWFYKKEIRLNHEYLADKQVITNGIEICDYQKFILGFVFRNNSSYLASNFNYSFIKKRFIMLTKEKSSVRARIKAAITIPVITIMAVIISFNQNIIAMNNGFNLDKEWWNPILEKHKLVPDKAFNNFENIFEMADQISMKNNVSTLTNAVVIIKSNDKNSDYMLIEGPLVKHDLDSGAIEVHEGTIKFYKMDSEISNPVAHAHGDKMIINADNASFN